MSDKKREHTRCLIIGSGPAGYTAAIYTGRAGIRPIVYCGMQTGGQLTQTTTVENFPGFAEGIDGNELMMNMRSQAERYGAELRDGEIVSADLDRRPYLFVSDQGDEITADTVILATGATAKYLDNADVEAYKGRGVSACATCDGFFYRKRTVAVVGGGDTACEEALYLAGLAAKVYMLVRKPYLRASEVMQQRVAEAGNIEILYEHNVEGLYGGDVLKGAHLVARKGETDERHYDLDLDGLFMGIGHSPASGLLAKWLPTDAAGYIQTDAPLTGIEGVFVAGDVADSRYRQAITAAASGCKAALEVERMLSSR